MGIVSDPRGLGKGIATGSQGGASPKPGWTRGDWERPDPPEGRERRARGTGRRSSAYGGAQEADDPQATLPAPGTPGEVHGGQPQQEGCDGLGLRGERRRGRSIRGLRRARIERPREDRRRGED